MFRIPELSGLEVVKPSEEVLKIAPWLWAFDKIWAEGFCSQTGSVHLATRDVFLQKFDETEDQISEIFFLLIHEGIWQAKQVPKLKRFAKDSLSYFEPNPGARDGTITERIISATGRSRELIAEGVIYIPQVVIRIPGQVDRTSHYLIYQGTTSCNWETIATRDVLKIILNSSVFSAPA